MKEKIKGLTVLMSILVAFISFMLFIVMIFDYNNMIEKNEKLEKQIEHQTMLIEILERTCE